MNKQYGTNMEITKRDEYIFIDYLKVIKNPDIFLLKMIRDKHLDSYKGFLDTELIANMSDTDIELFILRMNEENLFRSLAIKEFNVERAYEQLYYKYDDMFMHSDLLNIGVTLPYLESQKFTKTVYLYTEKYDARVDIDIKASLPTCKKIQYVHGDIDIVLQTIIKPTSYILFNQWTISVVNYFKMLNEVDIMLALYTSNVEMRFSDNESTVKEIMPKLLLEELLKDNIFKFGFFNPLKNKEEYIEKIK